MTAGEPSATRTRSPRLWAWACKSSSEQPPHPRQCKPAASQGAEQLSACRRHCGSKSKRRLLGTAATWSRQKAEASTTMVQPTQAAGIASSARIRSAATSSSLRAADASRSMTAATSPARAAIRSRSALG